MQYEGDGNMENLTEQEIQIAIDVLNIMIQQERDPERLGILVTEREELELLLQDKRSEEFALSSASY